MNSELQIELKKIQVMLLKSLGLVLFFSLMCFPLSAQFTIRFDVYDPAQKTETFLAGTFNNWNPGDSSYKLIVLDATHKYIILKNILPGKYSFKFTRGTWGSVESTSDGGDIGNRTIEIRKDTAVQLHIAGWADGIKGVGNFPLPARCAVRFDVYDPTKKTETFLAGSFNDWNPGDSRYKLTVLDSTHKYIILKDVRPGKVSFKFTRGNWGTVESAAMGFDMDDRALEITKDTTVQMRIAAWIDDYIDLTNVADSTRLEVGWERSLFYLERNLDSSYKYAQYSFELSKKIDDKKSETRSLIVLGDVFKQQGNSDKALELLLQALPMAEMRNDSLHLVMVNQNIGNIFESETEYNKAKYYYGNAIKYTLSATDIRAFWRSELFLSLGNLYFNASKLDSAAYYADQSNEIQHSTGALLLLGDIEKKLENKVQAMVYYRQSAAWESLSNISSIGLAKAYQRLAQEFTENNLPDSGFYYARLSWAIANQVKNPFGVVDAGILLSKLFEKENRFDSAFFYQHIVIKTKDSLFTREKEKQIHNLVFNEQLHKQEIEAQNDKFRSNAWIYSLAAGLFILLLTAGLLIRNNRQKKEANRLLQMQKKKIESTLTELKSTQSLLIQSEKMASLGELTAGIAHEIQNPLNFVNNFSEVNNELIDELKSHLASGETKLKAESNDEQDELLNDIYQNNEKISFHGKRADAIVKGMLQHSRSSSGIKEPTDVNVLADEYLRLAYHGLRAKDKEFNATMKTDYDETIGNINIIPQDIGRVILNLITNAFYAASLSPPGGGGFKDPNYRHEPTVWVSTKKIGDKVLISVRDNGPGIPQKVLDKIFQPFFTTKPTGEGTGLGLSLSYDIVKAHGGEIKVETKYVESLPAEASAQAGSNFIIELPLTKA
ncbi:MAG: ATP-binding protein [Chitinophagales bacterium]